MTELAVSKINKGIAKSNLAIQQMVGEEEEPVGPKGVMGFALPVEEIDDNEEEDDDEIL